LLELKLTRLLIECITGHSTILFRAPYNADSEPTTSEEIIPVALARQQNYLDIGENIDPEDWQPGIKADEIVKRVMAGIKSREEILYSSRCRRRYQRRNRKSVENFNSDFAETRISFYQSCQYSA
jgi:aryl-alcohol dehydrogenase-like predicted oxidoreductase